MISAITSIRNWATALVSSSTPRAPPHRPAAALIQPASPITKTSTEAPAKATHCTSDDTAFDLLFAVYHLHYLESEQKYKTWRRSADSTHRTLPTASQTAIFGFEDSVSAEGPETPFSPQPSVFSDYFEDDDSSTSTSTISTTSEESVEDVKSTESSSDSDSDKEPTSPTIYTGRIASAIPRHITSENYATPKPDLSRWVRIADLDTIEDYDVQCLTPTALEEAERRSRDLRRYARMSAADLRESFVPLKAHEHPEPRGMLRPSALKDLGKRSRLCASWTVEDVADNEVDDEVEEAESAGKKADDNLDALCCYLRSQIA